jgi:hypothetical protein
MLPDLAFADCHNYFEAAIGFLETLEVMTAASSKAVFVVMSASENRRRRKILRSAKESSYISDNS